MIIVEYKSDVLGNGELWRGDEKDVAQIRNICAREIAYKTAKDGQPRVDGMWHVRQEIASVGAK